MADNNIELNRAKTVNLPYGWGVYTDDEGTEYYFNEFTGESSWDPPDHDHADDSTATLSEHYHFDNQNAETSLQVSTSKRRVKQKQLSEQVKESESNTEDHDEYMDENVALDAADMNPSLLKDPGIYSIIPRLSCVATEDDGGSIPEIAKYLSSRHRQILICNLCDINLLDIAESILSSYDNIKCLHFPFAVDGACPAFELLGKICTATETFLKSSLETVVCFICEDAFYKCGLAIASYLLHKDSNIRTAKESVDFFLSRRRAGLGYRLPPSYIRWVYYYVAFLEMPQVMNYTLEIDVTRLETIPNFSSSLFEGNAGCRPYVTIDVLQPVNVPHPSETNAPSNVHFYQLVRLYSGLEAINQQHRSKEVDTLRGTIYNADKEELPPPFVPAGDGYVTSRISSVDTPIRVRGNVCVSYFSGTGASTVLMSRVWFHTAFVEDHILSFEKEVIDEAAEDVMHYVYDKEFSMQIFMHRVRAEKTEEEILKERMTANKATPSYRH